MQAPEPLHLSTQSVRWFPQIAQYDCAIFVPRLKLELVGGGSAPATFPARANIATSTKTIRIIHLFATSFEIQSIEVFAFAQRGQLISVTPKQKKHAHGFDR
jgi:hypothetical protein